MKTIKSLFLIGALLAMMMFTNVTDAQARGRVYVRVAPPKARALVVVKPACPYKHGVWVKGRWEWRNGKHVWNQGRWIKARSGYIWIDGHWRHTPHGWEWIPGRWKRV